MRSKETFTAKDHPLVHLAIGILQTTDQPEGPLLASILTPVDKHRVLGMLHVFDSDGWRAGAEEMRIRVPTN
jgi:hypothetical protein